MILKCWDCPLPEIHVTLDWQKQASALHVYLVSVITTVQSMEAYSQSQLNKFALIKLQYYRTYMKVTMGHL